jgi:hypothetical protein
MPNDPTHISDRDLLLAADGELEAVQAAEVRAHLEACWTCRARMKDLEDTIAGFIHAHHRSLDGQLPPAGGPRSLLRARMAQIAASAPPRTRWRRSAWNQIAVACSLAALVAMGAWLVQSRQAGRSGPRLIPDPRLTPGAALPVSQADVCTEELGTRVRFIPASMGRKVFEEYGIGNPGQRAYELDYLIDPELGGSDDIRNFWPQPYAASGWNSHLKDALEDRLHELVCAHKVSLAAAQHDISTDWISAYKKYFQTDQPLASHSAFSKDRPWDP